MWRFDRSPQKKAGQPWGLLLARHSLAGSTKLSQQDWSHFEPPVLRHHYRNVTKSVRDSDCDVCFKLGSDEHPIVGCVATPSPSYWEARPCRMSTGYDSSCW